MSRARVPHPAEFVVGVLMAFQLGVGLHAQVAPATGKPAGNLRIAGTVVNATTRVPLDQTRVVLQDVKGRQPIDSVVTAENGRFEFTGLAAGKYSLIAARRGFIPGAYDQHDQFSTAIVTGAGVSTEDLVFRLPPAASISGRIVDEAGDAVRRASVTLYRQGFSSGVARIEPFRNETADDLGTYEFTPIPAGTYFVGVVASPWYATPIRTADRRRPVDRVTDVAYPVTYYADATESDDATPVLVRSGDHTEIDIRLQPQPALRLRVRTSDSPENAQPVLQRKVFDSWEEQGVVGAESGEEGVMELSGVAPGRYRVRMQGPSGDVALGTVDLARDSQELDGATGEAAGNVKIKVEVQGEDKVPEQLLIGLQNAQRQVVAFSPIDERGEANFVNLTPGTYSVLAPSRGQLYSVMRLVSAESASTGNALTIGAGESLNLTASLVSGSASVGGVARRDAKPVAGAMIVLVPKNPDSNYQFFRRDQSDLDGSFNLRNVVAGDYTVIAIENGWDLDWSSPGVIAHYTKKGTPVKVAPGAKGEVKLSGAVAVQSR